MNWKSQTLRRICSGILVVSSTLLNSRVDALADHRAIGVRVPDGFAVELYADDELAHDIFAMTTDAQGRIVVAGPGYIRILIDSDGDGRADTYRQFADAPAGGVQGMEFHGRDLICSAGEGVVVYRDRDGDDQADGPAEVVLKIATGGEHNAHAIRRGPDGWWYIIAGNTAGVTSQDVSLSTSPVAHPQEGTVLRLMPDLTGTEVVADGFRNAYDFDFNHRGDLFTFDSDGERDVSLPWYRPTRVFHILPGSNAGWMSRSWKRPGHFFDMPPVVAEFGRGSPTGVECYRHTQFPAGYQGALFVLDWTFGRIFALPLIPDGATWRSRPETFMTGVGEFGFAPTDVTVGPDGSLYVSVGGRGTRGSVFRIRYAAGAQQTSEPQDQLHRCLNAPQPLSAWSRAAWMPLAQELGRAAFVEAACDSNRTAAERMRAIEILTELFGGLDDQAVGKLAADTNPAVRARAAWSLGRTGKASPDVSGLISLARNDAASDRSAVEALLRADLDPLPAAAAQWLERAADSPSRYVRQQAARLIAGRDHLLRPLQAESQSGPSIRSRITLGFAALAREGDRVVDIHPEVLDRALAILGSTETPTALRLEAVRLAQLALGDVGPNDRTAPAFDGYSPRLDLNGYDQQRAAVHRVLADCFPTGHAELDHELGRLLAMVAPDDKKLLDAVLGQITEKSSPVDDIHHLIIAARVTAERSPTQRERMTQALLGLDPKIEAGQLKRDSNWDDRIGELLLELAARDPQLPRALVEHRDFGRPGHVIFLLPLPEEHLPLAIPAFVRQIQADAAYPWTVEVVYLLSESAEPAHRELLRSQYENFSLRNAVLLALALRPEASDRRKFIEGLDSDQLDVLGACLHALGELPADDSAAENFALLGLMRRLRSDAQEFSLREQAVKLLRRNTGLEFGFVLGSEGHTPQAEVMTAWANALNSRHADVAEQFSAASESGWHELQQLMQHADWNIGDVERGRKLFETRSCARCHGGRRALGPDLAGVTRRFSRDDVFTAIVLPNRDVSPRYQTTLIQTVEGKVYTGLIVYNSVDGLTLRDGQNRTFRIEADDIELRRTMPQSLMPAGLLKDLQPQDLSDLYAYIRSLGDN